jgi:hypothetical protein
MHREKRRVLVVDVGGSHVKAWVTGKPRKKAFASGPGLTPEEMVAKTRRLVKGWDYDVISLGYPGPVVFGRVIQEPPNLGRGWVGFDFERAFGYPVKVVNDAALPAIGCYKGGRMLYLGLGTGLGTVIIVDGCLEAPDLTGLRYRGTRSYGDYLGKKSFERLGPAVWERHVHATVRDLKEFFAADYVKIGGGNASELRDTPEAAELAPKNAVYKGGALLWSVEEPVRFGQLVRPNERAKLAGAC